MQFQLSTKIILILILTMSWTWCDTITYFVGRPKTDVTVTQDTYQQTVFRTETSDAVKMDANIIQRIDYEDAPAVFLDAQNALARGEYEKAVKWYSEALEVAKQPPVVRDWIQHYAMFGQAKAYQGWGERLQNQTHLQSALQAYDKALASKEVTRFYPEIHFGKAQVYITLQEAGKAQDSLEQLNQLVGNLKSDAKDRWQFRVAMLRGELFLAQKNYSSAIQQYQEAKKIAAAQKRTSDLQDSALAIGNIYIQQNDFRQAESYFSRLPQEHPDIREIEAGSKNGLAWCYCNQQKYTQARQLALEVLLRFPQSSQQPMSLFILGRCYQNLAAKEKGAAETAQIYYNWLKTNYPDSEWTKQIEK